MLNCVLPVTVCEWRGLLGGHVLKCTAHLTHCVGGGSSGGKVC